MNQATIHSAATAALARLQAKYPGLKEELEKCHAYIVFPSIGRASLVVGGAHGKGEVYERGRPVGFATLTQVTAGVQVGGQTFTELVLFDTKQAFDAFKRNKTSFNANASAVIVKAAASGTDDSGGVTARAYSRGGMLLEASLGGQKMSFVPGKARGSARRSSRSTPRRPSRTSRPD